MKMLGAFDVRREAAAHLVHGEFPVDVGKHIDAALTLGIDGNPGERRLLALDGFNAGEVQAVVNERLGYQATALVIADESEPAGAGAEPRNLGEVVAGNAAGVNFQAIGIDLLIGAQEARHDREVVDATASDSYDLRGHLSPQ